MPHVLIAYLQGNASFHGGKVIVIPVIYTAFLFVVAKPAYLKPTCVPAIGCNYAAKSYYIRFFLKGF
jgi:hypothetical protein